MTELDKIIKGLECCITDGVDCPDDCPYLGDCNRKQLHTDALAILKAQEPKTGHWVDYCCRDFRCSDCGHKLVNNNWVHADGYCYDDLPKYCPECGIKMGRGIIQRRFIGEDKIVYPVYKKR